MLDCRKSSGVDDEEGDATCRGRWGNGVGLGAAVLMFD